MVCIRGQPKIMSRFLEIQTLRPLPLVTLYSFVTNAVTSFTDGPFYIYNITILLYYLYVYVANDIILYNIYRVPI